MHLNLHATQEQLEKTAKAEKRKDARTNVLIITSLVAGFLGICYLFYAQYAKEARLDKEGQRVVGIIDNEYIESSRRGGSKIYDVRYTFVANGRIYNGSSTLLDKPFSRYRAIIYDPKDPNNNKAEGSKDSLSGWTEVLGIIIVAYLISGISYLSRKAKSPKG